MDHQGTLKLKLQYFGHLMQRMDSSEKIPILGKIEGIVWAAKQAPGKAALGALFA